MSQPDDLEARVTALETQVRELNSRVRRSEQDAAAARVLAGGADRDVNEIRGELRDFRQATTAGFNAMREDLVDLNDKVDRGFADVNGRLDNVNGRLDNVILEMRSKFDMTAAGQQQIVHLLNTVIAQQDGRTDDR
jgi:chromosome segregation ATPase